VANLTDGYAIPLHGKSRFWTIDRMLTLDFSSDANTYTTNFVHPATQGV